jgi:hypothetical protein
MNTFITKTKAIAFVCLSTLFFGGCGGEISKKLYLMESNGNDTTFSAKQEPIDLVGSYTVLNNTKIYVDWDRWAALSGANQQGYYLLVAAALDQWKDGKGQFYIMTYNQGDHTLTYDGPVDQTTKTAIPYEIDFKGTLEPYNTSGDELDYMEGGFAAATTDEHIYLGVMNKLTDTITTRRVHYFAIHKETLEVSYSGHNEVNEAEHRTDWSSWAASYDETTGFRLFGFNQDPRNTSGQVALNNHQVNIGGTFSNVMGELIKFKNVNRNEVKNIGALHSEGELVFFVEK